MKYFTSLMLILALTACAMSQTGKVFDLKFQSYRIALSLETPGALKNSNGIPLFCGRESDTSAYQFGVFLPFGGASPEEAPALDLIVAGSAAPLRTITAGELLGMENASWKVLPNRSKTTKTSTISCFEFTARGAVYRFIKTVELKKDNALPLGKSLNLSFSLETPAPAKFSARLHASFVGILNGGDGIYTIGSTDTMLAGHPYIIFRTTPVAAVLQTDSNLTVTSAEVETGTKATSPMITFTITGTSVRFAEHASKQSENLTAYFNNKKTAPSMISVTTVNKTMAHPGDTLTYTIYYHNIGTAPAADITLTNPIPTGAVYIEKSAAGPGTTITIARAGQSAKSAATSVAWKYKTPFLPGEERFVSFKVKTR